jgi:hypothetical protein
MRTLRWIVAALALVLPAQATAATITAGAASSDPAFQSFGPAGDGTLQYALPYRATLLLSGVVLDDEGQPVPAGTVVHVSTLASPTAPELALDDVLTTAGGAFRYTTVPARGEIYLTGVDASTGVTATTAAPIRVALVPNLRWTTKLRGQKGQPYRFDGVLDIPDPRAAGTMVLYRLNRLGQVVRAIARQHLRSDGGFHFRVKHPRSGVYLYRLSFVPADPWRWSHLSVQVAVVVKKR